MDYSSKDYDTGYTLSSGDLLQQYRSTCGYLCRIYAVVDTPEGKGEVEMSIQRIIL